MTIPVQGYGAGVLRTVVAIEFELGSTGSGTHRDLYNGLQCAGLLNSHMVGTQKLKPAVHDAGSAPV